MSGLLKMLGLLKRPQEEPPNLEPVFIVGKGHHSDTTFLIDFTLDKASRQQEGGAHGCVSLQVCECDLLFFFLFFTPYPNNTVSVEVVYTMSRHHAHCSVFLYVEPLSNFTKKTVNHSILT